MFDYEYFSEMDLGIEHIENPGDWALKISQALGAKEYINPPGGTTIFDPEQEFKLKLLKEEIDYCLKKVLTGRDKKRNRLIYQLHIYKGFSPKEIASSFDLGISTRRIANIISDSRQKLIKSWSLVEEYRQITC